MLLSHNTSYLLSAMCAPLALQAGVLLFTSRYKNFGEPSQQQIDDMPITIAEIKNKNINDIMVFAGVVELVDWVIARGRENGYVLVKRRSKTNATGVVIKVWLKCDRGGVYQGEPKARHTGSKKTGCEFELIGKYERSYGGWKLRVVNSEHNHQGAEQLGGHPYAMRLN
ncbi:hypothetical protein E3N88_27300 [Mikania micrantha]|uniref:FAR1 domain-containing protein n=1 Tax=Mikania micrantha TaxID=192012 RepID=A0A5N6MWA3_9ASTR|nr:hypothetical protein E3N88_27300 [Mikania micrantha]